MGVHSVCQMEEDTISASWGRQEMKYDRVCTVGSSEGRYGERSPLHRDVCQAQKPYFRLRNKEMVFPRRLLVGFSLNVLNHRIASPLCLKIGYHKFSKTPPILRISPPVGAGTSHVNSLISCWVTLSVRRVTSTF